MSFNCLLNALNSSVTSNGTGIRTLSRDELINKLKAGGMSEAEIEGTMKLLNEVYSSVAKEALGRRLSPRQRSLVNVVYGKGLGNLNPGNIDALEAVAEVLDIPFISGKDMVSLRQLATQADEREGAEKALVEDKIRDILDQKNDDYYMRLASSKVAFKILLSIGFNLRAAMSNKKKRFETLLIEKMKYANQGGNWVEKFTRFMKPFPLAPFTQYNREHAAAARNAIRGKGLGFGGGEVLLGPSASYNSDIGTRSDQLEYANEREVAGIKGGLRRIDRQIARAGKRWTSSIDAAAKVRMGEYFYFNQLRKQLKEKNPAWTEQEVIKAVHDEMFAIGKPEAIQIAIQQFKDWKIELDSTGEPKQNSARFKVRVAEIMKSKRDPALMNAAYEMASGKVWQGRMTYFRGTFRQRIDSGLGGIIADAVGSLRDVAQGVVEKTASGTTARSIGQGVVFNMFGFINGAAAYWQDFMEHNMVYAAGKILRLKNMQKNYKKNGKLSVEDMDYLEDKIIEMHGKFLYGMLETAAVFALAELGKTLCGESLGGNVNPDKPVGEDAVLANTQQQRGESSIGFCNTVNIPFEYLGGFSFANTKLIAAVYNGIENKDENYLSAFATGVWLTSSPSISPLMDKNPGPATRIWEVFSKAYREGKGYESVGNVAAKELSYAGADLLIKMLPVPNRVLKEVTVPIIPYRQYQPAGIGLTQGMGGLMVQYGRQFAWNMGNVSGITQLANMFTTTDGKIGRPLFDYRHRPIDAANLYDGTSLASLSQPIRALAQRAKGKDPILYDEVDHFLNMNDVAIPWDSRIYTTLHKDTDKQRLLTDNEYYSYQYAYTKKFGDWIENHYAALKDDEPKDIRNRVRAALVDIKKRAIKQIENNGKLDGEEIYQRIK